MNFPPRKSENFRTKGRKRRPVQGGSELGDLLETLRTDQGWTLETAAMESGISIRVIAKLEKGRHDTSIANLEKYLNLFGLTLSAKRIEIKPKEPEAPMVSLDEKGLPKW